MVSAKMVILNENKTVLYLFDLNILLNSGRHQMLSKLASLYVSSLRKLDDEANKFYDRKHNLYEAALLTRCYTQHALRPYIDSEINHIRHFCDAFAAIVKYSCSCNKLVRVAHTQLFTIYDQVKFYHKSVIRRVG